MLFRSCGHNCHDHPGAIPSHRHSKKKADIVFDLLVNGREAVGDVTVYHPFTGVISGPDSRGSWQANLERARFNHKKQKHQGPYAGMNLHFLPLVVSTFGVLQDDFLRLLWLATSASGGSGLSVGEVREHKGSDVRQMLFSKMRSRISVAAARSCAMRYDAFCGFKPSYPVSHKYIPSDPLFAHDNRLVGTVIGPTRGVLLGGES